MDTPKYPNIGVSRESPNPRKSLIYKRNLIVLLSKIDTGVLADAL